MGELTQVIIKSGRGEGGFEYQGHYRAGIFFSKHGRECIVDDRPVLKLKADLDKEADAVQKSIAEIDAKHGFFSGAAQEQRDRAAAIARQLNAIRAGHGHVEEAGKPLVITQKLYEYLREANGKALMFEPWDGAQRADPPAETGNLTPDERITKLEQSQGEIRGMLQQLLGELKKK